MTQNTTTDDATDAQKPTPVGRPQRIGSVEEPCHGCGVVQEMGIKQQRYEDNPTNQYTVGECPVCGNDHAANPPW